eukprot:TRINITY_DN30936_c0_g1_i4.p1 TRINITY_DN30936_c0_g1~~TRINITY_DN30936_c0_g1_i4.p1  ORF type:complete len:717 (+),score=159.37 TRINITY_DN30936_c0_g1_i4:145-2295(+)
MPMASYCPQRRPLPAQVLALRHAGSAVDEEDFWVDGRGWDLGKLHAAYRLVRRAQVAQAREHEVARLAMMQGDEEMRAAAGGEMPVAGCIAGSPPPTLPSPDECTSTPAAAVTNWEAVTPEALLATPIKDAKARTNAAKIRDCPKREPPPSPPGSFASSPDAFGARLMLKRSLADSASGATDEDWPRRKIRRQGSAETISPVRQESSTERGLAAQSNSQPTAWRNAAASLLSDKRPGCSTEGGAKADDLFARKDKVRHAFVEEWQASVQETEPESAPITSLKQPPEGGKPSRLAGLLSQMSKLRSDLRATVAALSPAPTKATKEPRTPRQGVAGRSAQQEAPPLPALGENPWSGPVQVERHCLEAMPSGCSEDGRKKQERRQILRSHLTQHVPQDSKALRHCRPQHSQGDWLFPQHLRAEALHLGADSRSAVLAGEPPASSAEEAVSSPPRGLSALSSSPGRRAEEEQPEEWMPKAGGLLSEPAGARGDTSSSLDGDSDVWTQIAPSAGSITATASVAAALPPQFCPGDVGDSAVRSPWQKMRVSSPIAAAPARVVRSPGGFTGGVAEPAVLSSCQKMGGSSPIASAPEELAHVPPGLTGGHSEHAVPSPYQKMRVSSPIAAAAAARVVHSPEGLTGLSKRIATLRDALQPHAPRGGGGGRGGRTPRTGSTKMPGSGSAKLKRRPAKDEAAASCLGERIARMRKELAAVTNRPLDA